MAINSPVVIFTQVCPSGYVADVQFFRVNILDVNGAGIPPDSFHVSITLDGTAEVFNQDIFVSPLDGFYPCRVIAEGGQTIKVVANFPYAALVTSMSANITLTGQLVPKNQQQPQNTALVQPLIQTKGV